MNSDSNNNNNNNDQDASRQLPPIPSIYLKPKILDEPLMDHLTSKDYQDVYEPAQDSFLFIDALKSELDSLKQLNPTFLLEIGSGSGFVITYLASILKTGYYLSTDINPKAAQVSSRTAKHNNVVLDVINTSFVDALARLKGSIDVLLFNPPYVPTPTEEIHQGGITASWAGGIDGREVIDLLLPQINEILSPKGCLYMVLVAENHPNQVASILRKQGFKSKVVAQRKAYNELLYIIKYYRRPTTN